MLLLSLKAPQIHAGVHTLDLCSGWSWVELCRICMKSPNVKVQLLQLKPKWIGMSERCSVYTPTQSCKGVYWGNTSENTCVGGPWVCRYDLWDWSLHCSANTELLFCFFSGPNRGHYIAIVKSHDFWLLFDDDIVEVSKFMCRYIWFSFHSNISLIFFWPCCVSSFCPCRKLMHRL